MHTVLLALLAAASLTATWFFCLRPRRQGRCGMSGARQIAELREVRVLRAQDALSEGRPMSRHG